MKEEVEGGQKSEVGRFRLAKSRKSQSASSRRIREGSTTGYVLLTIANGRQQVAQAPIGTEFAIRNKLYPVQLPIFLLHRE